MKICFINPAPRSYITERGHETTGAYPPLGILYVMGYLKREGYDCTLIDQHATKIPTTQVLERVKKIDPGKTLIISAAFATGVIILITGQYKNKKDNCNT